MRIRSLIIALVAASACVLAAATSGYASTGPATGTVRVMSNGHIEDHVVSAALASKINSGDWRDLSVQQLASVGIHPGMTAAGAAISAVAVPRAAGHENVSESSSGCNYSLYDSMCIYLFGSGLLVDDWDTSVSNYFALDKCTYAGYWVAGVLTGTSNVVCGTGDFWAYSTPAQYYINGTQLCNTWLGWAGKPCEIVRS